MEDSKRSEFKQEIEAPWQAPCVPLSPQPCAGQASGRVYSGDRLSSYMAVMVPHLILLIMEPELRHQDSGKETNVRGVLTQLPASPRNALSAFYREGN